MVKRLLYGMINGIQLVFYLSLSQKETSMMQDSMIMIVLLIILRMVLGNGQLNGLLNSQFWQQSGFLLFVIHKIGLFGLTVLIGCWILKSVKFGKM